jgi:hypothetical protein
MALAVDLELENMELDDLTELEDTIPETKTYAINWNDGRIAGKISEMEALRQYIKKTLKVEKGKFLIYGSDIGCDVKEMLSVGVYSKELIETRVPQSVKDALDDKRIIRVYDFSFEYPGDDSLIVSFYVDTIYGVDYEEVVF